MDYKQINDDGRIKPLMQQRDEQAQADTASQSQNLLNKVVGMMISLFK